MAPRTSKWLSPIFNTTPKYKLSQELANIFQYRAKNNTKTEKGSDTIDIVSPGLCGTSVYEDSGTNTLEFSTLTNHHGLCL